VWRWQDDAECRGEDLVLFFGPPGERQPEREAREAAAREICAACPVRLDCLEVELERPPAKQWGMWGGLTEDERARVRKRVMARRRAEEPVDLEGIVAQVLAAAAAREAAADEPEPGDVSEEEEAQGPLEEACALVIVPDPADTTDGPPPALVDATGPRRILQAMTAAGHSLTTMADASGLTVTALGKIRRGVYPEVRLSSAIAIRRMWGTLPVPASAADAERSRRKAAREGWVPAAAWAGLDITDPDAVPLDLESESAPRRPLPAVPAA